MLIYVFCLCPPLLVFAVYELIDIIQISYFDTGNILKSA
jgi:hypothetical protein